MKDIKQIDLILQLNNIQNYSKFKSKTFFEFLKLTLEVN